MVYNCPLHGELFLSGPREYTAHLEDDLRHAKKTMLFCSACFELVEEENSIRVKFDNVITWFCTAECFNNYLKNDPYRW